MVDWFNFYMSKFYHLPHTLLYVWFIWGHNNCSFQHYYFFNYINSLLIFIMQMSTSKHSCCTKNIASIKHKCKRNEEHLHLPSTFYISIPLIRILLLNPIIVTYWLGKLKRCFGYILRRKFGLLHNFSKVLKVFIVGNQVIPGISWKRYPQLPVPLGIDR